MEFLTSLVSAQTYYLRACLRMIVKLFLPGNNETKCCIFPSNLDCLIFFYFINGFKSIELNILLGVSSVTILRKVFFLSIRCAPPPPPASITPKGICEISETLRRYSISKKVSSEACTKS